MRMRIGWISALSIAVCLLIGINWFPHSASGATTQSLAYVPGFPRDEPTGPIWAGSPTVADIDGNGTLDILTGDNNGCVWGWNNHGQLLNGFPWKSQATCDNPGRFRNSLAVANIDGNPGLEVAAATDGQGNNPGERGEIVIWNHNGTPLSGWPKEMEWTTGGTSTFAEAHSVVLANISGDTKLEVMAGTSNSGGGPNLYAWRADGTNIAGFPTNYKTGGIFGAIGAADMNGDGYAEVIAGRDQPWAHVYLANGAQLPGWPVSSYYDPNQTTWNIVKSVEFTHNAPTIGDLDGNGSMEVVIAGRTRDNALGIDPPHWIGAAIMVFEANGARRAGWVIPPLSVPPLVGGPWPTLAPALADLDGDGKLEIVVTLFDGTIRAFRENGTPYWNYNYAHGHALYGSEPAIGDITGDGILDVVFGTYSPDASANANVGLLALNGRTGQLLPGYPLPLNRETVSGSWGVMAAPTIANINQDCNAELIAASMSGVVYVWKLPAPFIAARMPWPTGRQNYQRTGMYGQAVTPPISSLAIAAVQSHTVGLPMVSRGCS